MATDKDSKTEEPTHRRLEEAEKEGDIPRSKELTASVGLFFTLIFFAIFMPYFTKTTIIFWKKYFNMAGDYNLTANLATSIAGDFFKYFLLLTAPLFLLLTIVAVGVEILQGGGVKIVGKRLSIKWDKVFFLANLHKGLKKILVSVEALFELAKSIVKVIIIGFIAYYSIVGEIPELLTLPSRPLDDIMTVMGKVFLKLVFNIIIFLIILSVLDYLWQKHQYIKKLKMSKQDIKDEYKNIEGDPKIKGRQRKIQYEQAMRRMMAEVPEADVVITNPTHYAVALKYELKKMHSPKVIAKGKNLIAEKIKEVARKNKVPVIENPPVARALFAAVDIGEFIPEELFKPVAEILAYIYKLKGKKFN